MYAVWPCSFVFLVLYSFATQRFSRGALFNIVVSAFLLFYAGFGLAYPHSDAIHLHALADAMSAVLPAGLSGLVGMVRGRVRHPPRSALDQRDTTTTNQPPPPGAR